MKGNMFYLKVAAWIIIPILLGWLSSLHPKMYVPSGLNGLVIYWVLGFGVGLVLLIATGLACVLVIWLRLLFRRFRH